MVQHNDTNINTERRSFFKYSVFGLISLLFGRYFLNDLKAGESLTPLSESDPTAIALGYHSNGSKVNVKKWTKKSGSEGKSQVCSNCILYTGLDQKSGKCQIFPNHTVSASGWCNSWLKKN